MTLMPQAQQPLLSPGHAPLANLPWKSLWPLLVPPPHQAVVPLLQPPEWTLGWCVTLRSL